MTTEKTLVHILIQRSLPVSFYPRHCHNAVRTAHGRRLLVVTRASRGGDNLLLKHHPIIGTQSECMVNHCSSLRFCVATGSGSQKGQKIGRAWDPNTPAEVAISTRPPNLCTYVAIWRHVAMLMQASRQPVPTSLAAEVVCKFFNVF